MPKKRKSRARPSPPEYTVEFMGREYTCFNPVDASKRIRQMIEFGNYGFSEVGAEFPVRDEAGNIVAYVTYNGKVWDGKPGESRLIYKPGEAGMN